MSDETASEAGQPRRRRAEELSTLWPVFAPPAELASGPLGAVQAADREIARQTAARARAVAEFAAARPASEDRAQGEPGAMSPERWAARPELLRPVSEWAAQELSVALSISQPAAEKLIDRSLTLVHRLPGVLVGMEAGAVTERQMWPLLDLVAPIEKDETRAQTEAELLRWLVARTSARKITTPGQLRDKAHRVVLRRDARAAARRLERAIRERGVFLRPEPTEGMAAVTSVLTGPEARALYQALGAYADALPKVPEDTRSRGQKMADCLLDLVLRPGESEQPPVQVVLHLVASVQTALGGDAPGELDGQVVPAEVVRQLLRLLAGYGGAVRADTAAEGNADTVSGPSEPPAVGAAREPVAPEPAWEELCQRELADWWEDVERRLFAGELGDAPDPIPEKVLVAWATEQAMHGDRFVDSVDLLDAEPASDVVLEDLYGGDWPGHDWLDGGDRDGRVVLDLGGSSGPPDARPGAGELPPGAEDDDPPGQAPPGGGWWADADRAVVDAEEATFAAQRALRHARRLVRTAERADAADESGWRAGPAGRVDAAPDALAALAVAADTDRQALADLLARSGGGGLAERPRLALVDALTGALVSLTDLPELRRAAHCGRKACRRAPEACTHDLTGRPGLGAPGPTDGYRPSAALDRFLRARDRRCRFPGCRRPMAAGELDHRVRWPDGPTAASNMAGLCTGDHRGKHQAPGWEYEPDPDGTLTVTTPSGLTAVTDPPAY